jgi:DNA topoisomerase IA
MKVLCVAEKPSIAKSITEILSGGQWQTVSPLCRPPRDSRRWSCPSLPNFTLSIIICHSLPPLHQSDSARLIPLNQCTLLTMEA